MAKRHGLNQQLSSLQVLKAGIAAGAIQQIEYYDNMTAFHLDVLNEVISTISFMKDHEGVIRQAIKQTKNLDETDRPG